MKLALIYIIILFLIPQISSGSPKIIIANNTRITYDYGSKVKPYVANEVKIVDDRMSTTFTANKFRLGFRYKINDNIRLDPHLFVDNKLKDDWQFSLGPAIRLDITY